MVYRNNTGRLGFQLHQCVLRNTLAGSKTVVSISQNPTVLYLTGCAQTGVFETHGRRRAGRMSDTSSEPSVHTRRSLKTEEARGRKAQKMGRVERLKRQRSHVPAPMSV